MRNAECGMVTSEGKQRESGRGRVGRAGWSRLLPLRAALAAGYSCIRGRALGVRGDGTCPFRRMAISGRRFPLADP